MINIIVVTILLVTISYLFLIRKIDLFQVLIFFFPFAQLSYDAGLTIYLYQVILFLLVLTTIFRQRAIVLANRALYLYLLYVVVGTIIISNLAIDDYLDLGGYFRSEGRYISQIILYLLMFSITIISHYYIRKEASFFPYIKIYIISVSVLCMLGIVQVVMFNFTGNDVFPLSIVGNIDREPVIFGRTIGFYIFRMSSFAGEPKSLAMHVIAAYFILQAFNKNKINLFSFDSKLKVLFLGVLLATLSTGGYVLFVILIIVTMVIRLFSNKSIKFHHINKVKIYSLLTTLFLGVVLFSYYDYLSIIFQNRILDREILSEDFDYVVISFLIDNLSWIYAGSGLGNIHNLSVDYIPNSSLRYMEGVIFVAKSGYLRLLSESGIIGLILFLLFNYVVYMKLRKATKSNIETIDNRHIESLKVILIVVTLMFLARGYSFGVYLIFFSIINSFAYCDRIFYRKKLR